MLRLARIVMVYGTGHRRLIGISNPRRYLTGKFGDSEKWANYRGQSRHEGQLMKCESSGGLVGEAEQVTGTAEWGSGIWAGKPWHVLYGVDVIVDWRVASTIGISIIHRSVGVNVLGIDLSTCRECVEGHSVTKRASADHVVALHLFCTVLNDLTLE